MTDATPASEFVADTDIPELHDRLIAGAARALKMELLTDDFAIQASAFVKTVW